MKGKGNYILPDELRKTSRNLSQSNYFHERTKGRVWMEAVVEFIWMD
jgi:hypothetical protein